MSTSMKTVSVCIFFINITTLAFSQNVGIGTTTPRAKLNVVATGAHVVAIEGTNPFISFYSSNDYKGYLWYNSNKIELGTSNQEPIVLAAGYNRVAYFTPQGRVGINTSTPSEVLDVNGKVNLKGIAINGSAGNLGQVYTTGGPDFAPEWKNMPFANTTRFDASISGGSATGSLSYTQRYNTNSQNITINANSININKTGLYHIDCFLYCSANYSSYAPTTPPTLAIFLFSGSGNYYGRNQSFMMEAKDYVLTTGKLFSAQVKFEYDIYITAGEALYLSRSFGYSAFPDSFTNVGSITGYLISE